MAEKGRGQQPLPGLEYSRLKTAVETMDELCADGTFMRFLSPHRGLRLIGGLDEFREKFSAKLKDDVDKQDARSALVEINNYLAAWILCGNLERMLSFLETEVFAEEFQGLSLQGKKRLRQQLEDKAKLVVDKLLSDSMRQRGRRLSTAVGACVEDLDVEVVSNRRDQLVSCF